MKKSTKTYPGGSTFCFSIAPVNFISPRKSLISQQTEKNKSFNTTISLSLQHRSCNFSFTPRSTTKSSCTNVSPHTEHTSSLSTITKEFRNVSSCLCTWLVRTLHLTVPSKPHCSIPSWILASRIMSVECGITR